MGTGSIEAVTLDLWFTLIAHDESYDSKITEARLSGISRALRDAGHDVPRERMEEAFGSSGRYLEQYWSTYRDMDTDGQVRVLLKCLGIAPEPGLVAAVADPYANAVLRVEPFLVDGAREALKALRDSGLKLALISNTGRTPGQAMRKVISRMGILDFFEVTTFSNEAGYLKPDPRIFEATLSQIEALPARTVHVGDHDLLDVKGAKGYGMKSVKVLQYASNRRPSDEADLCIGTMHELPDAVLRLMK
ncbi:MAG: putative HAD-hydrolase [Methanocella sp. PtaU1.Bin125]|nr:MAG: putative HAD-hydrolase [Methanocella sp. PtaU1.Bin125]